jgi:predicted MPP superfamily phosphohydrolase
MLPPASPTPEAVTRRRFLLTAGGVLAAVAAPTAYAFTDAPRNVGLSDHDVPVPDLPPALEGLRIAHVTDVHLYAGLHAPARRAMELVAGARPDVTLLTGDLCEHTSQLAELGPLLTACRGRLATIVLMGNWEYSAGITARTLGRCCEAVGAELLLNQSRIVPVGPARLALVGLDDPRAGSPDPEPAMRNVPADATAVWAFHAPGFADRIPRDRYPAPVLIAAGHTHGGQIRLPLLPPITPPASGRFVAGWYRDTFAPLYVSRGVGTSDIRARLFCPPEVPLFTLRRA